MNMRRRGWRVHAEAQRRGGEQNENADARKILKLLRVPRGSVRGKCGWRKGADGAPPSEKALGRGGKIMDGKIIF